MTPPRRASVDEADEIADLWLRARAASVPHIPAPIHSDDEVRVWVRQLVLPSQEVWVEDADAEIVGLLVLGGDWIEQLYVEPTMTGQGLGADLLAVAKKRRRTAGLRLWTFETNLGARRFYERHGFVKTGATEGANEEGAPDVRYEWSPPDLTR